MKGKFKIGVLTMTVLLLGLLFWWSNRNGGQILPAEPNPFVERVTISPIGESAVPFDDTITISVRKGVYAFVELHPFDDFPETFHGRDVAPPHRWPISFALYRPGRLSGPEEVVLSCHAPGSQLIEQQKPEEMGRAAPPRLINVGTTGFRTSANGYVGKPNLPERGSKEISYWTFLVATDKDNPTGEYVYEIRLYPTAKWVSKIRAERGEPLVLKRGLLIVVDEEEADSPSDAA